MQPSPWELVEIFRSSNKRAVNEHALVLQARGVAYQIVSEAGSYHLLVPAAQADAARAELVDYDVENVGWPPREDTPPMRSRGVVAAGIYAAILLLLHPMGRHGFLGRDFFGLGSMDASRVRDGELWRVLTALTLHLDFSHLAGNLVFGSAFAILAAHELGAGLGWFAIVLAGGLGNLANAMIQRDGFVSIGASTASFAALGLLSVYEWVRRKSLRLRPLRRIAPLLGGAALLGWLGTAGERTDVVAHVLGFLMGSLAGFVIGRTRVPEWAEPPVQRRLGVAALALIAAGWGCALTLGE